MPGLDISDTLKTIKGRNPIKFIRLLSLFASQHQHDMQKVQSLLAEGNIHEAQKIIHTLKGVMGNIGLHDCNALVIELDSALRNKLSPAECLRLAELGEQRLDLLTEKITNLISVHDKNQ